MGTFQAIASGLGQTGEDLGTGLNQALNEALKVRAQTHLENMDTAHLALAKAGQEQAYTLAQQQHELMRQQMLQSGWNHTGTVKDGSQYYQVYDNPRMPLGQQTTRIPYNGVPPDSFEAILGNYKTLRAEPGMDDDKAWEIAAKMPNLYRTDASGAGMLNAYIKHAEDLYKNQGIESIPVFGFGNIPINTPEGRAKYSQAMIDSGRGMAPLLKSMMGFGAGGKEVDMTGWTRGEVGEYKALETKAMKQEQILSKLMDTSIQSSMTAMGQDPGDTAQQAFDQLNTMMAPINKQLEEKRAEIDARHGRGVTPAAGQRWSKSAWAAAHPGQDANAAAAYAKAQGATVIP